MDSQPTFFDRCVKCAATSSGKACDECFKVYDTDGDGYLSKEEAFCLFNDLFAKNGTENNNTSNIAEQIFKLVDHDKDGRISKEDFRICWFYWLKQILDPVTALVVIDVQNDFLEGTLSLCQCAAGQDGKAVIPVINSLLDTVNFDLVVYSKDWHPENHISFVENVKLRKFHPSCKVLADEAQPFDTVIFDGAPPVDQRLWPAHCIQNSWGSELHPDLKVVDKGIIVNKGISPDVDSYSAFWDNNKQSQTELVTILSQHKVTDVYVCGVAYDVCVGFTANHSIDHGFRTVLIEDGCRGVDLTDIENTKSDLQKKGAVVVDSDQVADMVMCKVRRVEMGLQAARNVALARKLFEKRLV